MSLQSLRLSLEGTSSVSEEGRTRLTMRASTASSKSARDSFEAFRVLGSDSLSLAILLRGRHGARVASQEA